MENNINNKAKFFAQYYGQNIVCDGLAEGDTCSVEYAFSESIYVEAWLELKPLSSITDEDAYNVAKIIGHYNPSNLSTKRMSGDSREWTRISSYYLDPEGDKQSEILYNVCDVGTISHCKTIYHEQYLELSDFLRSKGYALPYMGLSVEEQVSRGWVKLKEN